VTLPKLSLVHLKIDGITIHKYWRVDPDVVEVAGRRITKYSIALLLIVLLGLALRFYNLTAQSFWWDEAFSAAVSTQALPRIVSITSADVHPPLYYFLLHYWEELFGTSDFAVRSLSVLFGVSAIPIIYVLGRRLFDEEVGLVSALILAISSFNVAYSQEARMYSLMLVLALLSMYFFIRFLEQNTLAISIGYVLSTVLLLYTHVFGLLIVIAQNIYLFTLLLSRERSFRLRHWIGLEAVVIALFAAWVPVVINRAQGAIKPLLGVNTLTQTLTVFSGSTLLLWLFVALAVLSLFAVRKISAPTRWREPLTALESYSWNVRLTHVATVYFLVVWLVTINVLPYVISLVSNYHIYLSKYVIAASAALYLLVGKGVRNINYNYAKIAVVGIIILLSASSLQTYYATPTKPQARDVMSYVDSNAKRGDLILVYPGSDAMIFNWYNERADLTAKNFPANYTDLWSKSAEANIKELGSDVAGHNRVWIISTTGHEYTVDLVKALYMKTLNTSYNATDSRSYFGYDVYLFEKRA
jgi:mannosyltransferase